MTRPANKKSAAANAVTVARSQLKTAQEAVAKTASPANAEALKKAKETVAAAVKTEKTERFKTVGGARVTKILAALDSFAACSKTQSYDFTAEAVHKAFTAITARVTAIQGQFTNALTGVKEDASEPAFKF